jgi:septation ring formation regulator EzrA
MLIIALVILVIAFILVRVIVNKKKEPSIFDDMGDLQPTPVANMSDEEIVARVNARVNGAFNQKLVEDAKANLEKM